MRPHYTSKCCCLYYTAHMYTILVQSTNIVPDSVIKIDRMEVLGGGGCILLVQGWKKPATTSKKILYKSYVGIHFSKFQSTLNIYSKTKSTHKYHSTMHGKNYTHPVPLLACCLQGQNFLCQGLLLICIWQSLVC